MAGSPLTIDASAIIAVVTHEAHRERLIQLSQGATLYAPASLPAEVGNAFSAMFKRRLFSLDQAQLALAAFRQIPVRLTDLDLEAAVRLSHRLGIYAYDAYVILCALELRAPLLTLDRGLRDAARRLSVEILEVSR